ncbi:MAG: Asp-tRNA(Asn)/Glu-tRNA(Gln) amidotransferase subunit GatA [Spirochaetia bacterium]|jgi:aspartyl-tRNA(Asn)/glutamyl-tRNA(Gln) amidotransferase subunit A|nr:Asp-tRNA(Asn)/Glu-tRNA(Gln) amidotransferase subunit GatA [Spirochaetia bacterium]
MQDKDTNISQNTDSYLKYVNDWEQKIGSFLEFDIERTKGFSKLEGPLAGIPFGVKDNFAVEGFDITCGSKILKGVAAPYTATSVAKLQDAGAVVVGKTNLDAFGMGSSTDNSAFKVTNNPWDTERVAGGSSGGSAAAVAAGLVPFALGSDTGGSVRQPASFCGVYGFKPTYGVVSRYGLTAYASSLDVVGVIAGTVEMTRTVFDIMKGQDIKDNTSVKHPGSRNNGDVKKIAVLKVEDGSLSKDVEDSYSKSIKRLEKLGFEINYIDLPSFEYVVPVYYTIATAEASANLARYNGLRYGYRSKNGNNPGEIMQSSRDEGFGDEVKLRILLGTYVLRSGFQDQFYHKAQKIRTAMRNEFDKIFELVDLIMMPVFPTAAFKHGSTDLDPFQQKVADLYTCAANLTGLPAFAVPSSIENGLPVGVQFTAPAFEEDRLFNIAEVLEAEFPSQSVEGVKNWSKV